MELPSPTPPWPVRLRTPGATGPPSRLVPRAPPPQPLSRAHACPKPNRAHSHAAPPVALTPPPRDWPGSPCTALTLARGKAPPATARSTAEVLFGRGRKMVCPAEKQNSCPVPDLAQGFPSRSPRMNREVGGGGESRHFQGRQTWPACSDQSRAKLTFSWQLRTSSALLSREEPFSPLRLKSHCGTAASGCKQGCRFPLRRQGGSRHPSDLAEAGAKRQESPARRHAGTPRH